MARKGHGTDGLYPDTLCKTLIEIFSVLRQCYAMLWPGPSTHPPVDKPLV